MIRFTIVLLCVVLLALAGCKGDTKKGAPGAPGAPHRKVSEAEVDELDVMTSEEPETTVANDEISTPADYEDEAAEKITIANWEAELEVLDEELSGE